MTDRKFEWNPPATAADDLQAWQNREHPDVYYVVVDEKWIVKLIQRNDNWIACYIRIPVDEPLIDPTWSARVAAELPKTAMSAIDRARSAASQFGLSDPAAESDEPR